MRLFWHPACTHFSITQLDLDNVFYTNPRNVYTWARSTSLMHLFSLKRKSTQHIFHPYRTCSDIQVTTVCLHASCHYWKHCTISTFLSVTLHVLHTPPLTDEFPWCDTTSKNLITLCTLAFDHVSSRPTITIHDALSWLYDDTDNRHMAITW